MINQPKAMILASHLIITVGEKKAELNKGVCARAHACVCARARARVWLQVYGSHPC